MKKIFIIGLFLFSFLAFNLSSCTKDDQYWEIQGFSINFFDNQGNQYIGDTIISNELYVQLKFTAAYSAVMRKTLPFINQAYAANEPEHPGLKHSISKLIVTSINDFNDSIAGTNIASKMVYCGQASTSGSCSHQTLESFIYNELKQEQPYIESATFKFLEKPIIMEQKLTFRFIDSQGKEFIGTSSTFYWK
jgi:hypothetical protein